jgi:hypothetical protein
MEDARGTSKNKNLLSPLVNGIIDMYGLKNPEQ